MGNMIDREATPKAQPRKDITLLTVDAIYGKTISIQTKT